MTATEGACRRTGTRHDNRMNLPKKMCRIMSTIRGIRWLFLDGFSRRKRRLRRTRDPGTGKGMRHGEQDDED